MGVAQGVQQIKLLAVSDEVDTRLYGNGAAFTTRSVPDLIIGCGDLPAYYLDYLVSKFDVPMYAIHGNHDVPQSRENPDSFVGCGASWIGNRAVRANGLLLAGFDGSLRYNDGAYQSTQGQMNAAVRALVPRLWLNRLRYGRFLDVLVTHAPPRGIHDEPDTCHTGFDAFRWLVETFQPRYHLHGHIHLYDNRVPTVTRVGATEVINVYPFREVTLELPS
jgi:Icc-related predicted phosphoesterase